MMVLILTHPKAPKPRLSTTLLRLTRDLLRLTLLPRLAYPRSRSWRHWSRRDRWREQTSCERTSKPAT